MQAYHFIWFMVHILDASKSQTPQSGRKSPCNVNLGHPTLQRFHCDSQLQILKLRRKRNPRKLLCWRKTSLWPVETVPVQHGLVLCSPLHHHHQQHLYPEGLANRDLVTLGLTSSHVHPDSVLDWGKVLLSVMGHNNSNENNSKPSVSLGW